MPSPRQQPRRRNALILVLTLLVAACGGGGSTPAPAPVVTPAPAPGPAITSFAVSPASISSGQSTTLSWAVSGAATLSLAPGIGAVSGTSVSVSPSATTTYTLTASNGSGSATSTATVTVLPPAGFVLDDQPVGDASISYLQIEISPDMRFMTWIEESPFAGGTSVAWLCALDPATGNLVPANGRGFKIADIRSDGSPQWGVDEAGVFSLTVNALGHFVVARPAFGSNGQVSAAVSILSTPANVTRSYPYPSRTGAPGGYVAYVQDDPLVAGRRQLWYIALNAPNTQVQVTQGPTASIGQFNLPPFLVDIQRWFYDVATRADGLLVLIYGDADPATPVAAVTVQQIDFSASPPARRQVADATPTLFDPFPFISGGTRYVFAGINATDSGGVFRQDTSGEYTVQVSQIQPTGSALVSPSNLASAEPFLRNGKVYTAFQINEPGAPGTTNGEIWLASVFDNAVLRRISLAAPSRRADPEFFFGTSKVWIFYYARPQNSGVWTLRRADTGL